MIRFRFLCGLSPSDDPSLLLFTFFCYFGLSGFAIIGFLGFIQILVMCEIAPCRSSQQEMVVLGNVS